MKNFVLFISLLLVLYSCGLDDYYYEKDKAPEFAWFGNESGDSLFLTGNVKIGQELVYNFRLKDFETENPVISLCDQEGEYSFKIIDRQFFITINKEGVCRGTLVASDLYDKRSKIKFDLTSFANKAPVAKCKVDKVGNLSNREIIIDLSESYDQDAEYGGFIEKYEYTITNSNGNVYTVSNGLKKLGYIFDEDGLQKIDFRVCDNNGDWSETGTTYVQF